MRGDDDGLPAVSVLDDVQQDRMFLGIKRHEEEVLESANAGLTCLIPQCGGQETLPGTERPGDEEVLRLSDELQRGQPFHLVSVKPAAMPWSFMRFISSRDTVLRSFSARTGVVFSFVFIAVSL